MYCNLEKNNIIHLKYGRQIMKEKNKKLWLELYSIVDKILKLEPWQKLTDNNLLMYISNKKMMYIILLQWVV